MAESEIRRAARLWVAGRLARGEINDKTANWHRVVLRGFTASFGARPVSRLGRRHVETWLGSLDVAPSSRRTYYSVVRCFCRHLVRERLVKRDPTIDVQTPKAPRSVPRAMSDDETAALLAVLPDARARAVVRLMLDCGLRRAEVAGLQLGDWDRPAGVLYVTGKGGHTRMLPVPSPCVAALEAYLAEHPCHAGPLVRTYTTGGPLALGTLSSLVRRWMEAAGVKHGPWDGKAPHALRHTMASRVVDVEPDLRVVQEALGHANLTSTQRYLRRATLGSLRAAMEQAAVA
jgi:site-specific recombinase XerC